MNRIYDYLHPVLDRHIIEHLKQHESSKYDAELAAYHARQEEMNQLTVRRAVLQEELGEAHRKLLAKQAELQAVCAECRYADREWRQRVGRLGDAVEAIAARCERLERHLDDVTRAINYKKL